MPFSTAQDSTPRTICADERLQGMYEQNSEVVREMHEKACLPAARTTRLKRTLPLWICNKGTGRTACVALPIFVPPVTSNFSVIQLLFFKDIRICMEGHRWSPRTRTNGYCNSTTTTRRHDWSNIKFDQLFAVSCLVRNLCSTLAKSTFNDQQRGYILLMKLLKGCLSSSSNIAACPDTINRIGTMETLVSLKSLSFYCLEIRKKESTFFFSKLRW